MAELENRWLDLGEFIREQRRIGELSLRKLSEMAGISNPYLSQIERGLRKPSAEILQQIARALEISSETLYVRAGILDDDREHDLISEIRRDPTLTEDQKKAMISIYDSFRAENTLRAATELALDDTVAPPASAAEPTTDEPPTDEPPTDEPTTDTAPADEPATAPPTDEPAGPAESLVDR